MLRLRGGSYRSLRLPQLLRETFKLFWREDLLVNHTEEKLLDRAGTEAVDDGAHRPRGEALGRKGRMIDEGLPYEFVSKVTPRFETAKNGSNTGIFEGMAFVQRFAH